MKSLRPGLGLEAKLYGLGLGSYGLALGLESCIDNFGITLKLKKLVIVKIIN